jgi:hypothetical protein
METGTPQPAIKSASRIAKLTAVSLIPALLFLAAWLALVHLNPTPSQQPEITLVDLQQLASDPQLFESLTSGLTVPDAPPDGWRATFEVRVPLGSALSLTHGPMGVEYSQADGLWTPAPDRGAVGFWQRWPGLGTVRVTSRRLTLSLPKGARTCRFTVGYRLPTLRERWLNTLSKTGIWKSHSKAVIMMAKWVPQTTNDHWAVCQRTIPLVLAPIRSTEPTTQISR